MLTDVPALNQRPQGKKRFQVISVVKRYLNWVRRDGTCTSALVTSGVDNKLFGIRFCDSSQHRDTKASSSNSDLSPLIVFDSTIVDFGIFSVIMMSWFRRLFCNFSTHCSTVLGLKLCNFAFSSALRRVRRIETNAPLCVNKREEYIKSKTFLEDHFVKGAGSRNVNKFLSKRRFCSIFDRPYHSNFPLNFSK